MIIDFWNTLFTLLNSGPCSQKDPFYSHFKFNKHPIILKLLRKLIVFDMDIKDL